MGFDHGNFAASFDQRLGRSSRAPLDLIRATVAIAGLTSGLSELHGTWLPLSSFAFSLMFVWSLVVALLPIISWRRDVGWSGFVMTIDFGIMAAIIVLQQNLILFVVPYALLLFFALRQAFLPRLQLLATAGIAVLLAIFGATVEPLIVHPKPDAGDLMERTMFVLLCILALVAVRMRSRYVRTLRLWSDGLLIAGTHSQRIPLEFILERVESRYPGSASFWVENEDSDSPRLLRWSGGAVDEVVFPAVQWAKSKPWMLAERAFMFDTETRHILHRTEVEHPMVSSAEDGPIPFIEALGFGGWGISFPVRVAEESARVFIMGTERPSVPALREGIEVGRAVEAVFERFHFQSAWRERAFVEARMALGRDLHDTVLQTMASLRMQIATMLSRPVLKSASETRDAILQLQSTIAEEQRTFREILEEGHRVAAEAVDLNAVLANRMLVLSEQWRIDCSFIPAPEALMVDGNTAVEVEFIIREVVSNSVQHGRAKSLAVRISLADGMLLLAVMNNEDRPREIVENGTGGEIKSKSLARRLTSLRASAYADDIVKGSLLSIRIPLSRN